MPKGQYDRSEAKTNIGQYKKGNNPPKWLIEKRAKSIKQALESRTNAFKVFDEIKRNLKLRVPYDEQLKENQRLYEENFVKLLDSHGTKDHKDYIKVERYLSTRDSILRRLCGKLAKDNIQDRTYKVYKSTGKHRASKTHCWYGHPYTKDNTYQKDGGYRQCLICKRKLTSNWKKRTKGIL